MAQKTNSFERFWKELKRRKVVHVITVYAAIAFVILQLANMVARPLQLPDWTEALVIVLLCIGFVIVIFLSWVYDLTPSGVRKTKPVSTVKHIDQTIMPTSSGWKIATYVSAFMIVALVAFNFISRRNLNSDISKLDKSIAVLPFRNDSPKADEENTAFINGLMDEIIINLQTIKNLRVLGRTSVEQYRYNRTKSNTEIARELGVTHIVEASGQKYENSFRLRVQLIKAKGKETPLWAKPYQQEIRAVTDIFKIHSQIAQAIAAELKAIITPEEKQLIEKTSTANLDAYYYYRRGRDEHIKYWLNNKNLEALEKAEDFYHDALHNDSTFANAYVGLAMTYWDKHYWESRLSENLMDSMSVLCDLALDYDEQLSDAYTAKGDYYSAVNMKDEALEEYNRAIKINPNDYRAYIGIAFLVYKNDYCMAIINANKAISIYRVPLLSSYLYRIGGAYYNIGFMEKAKNCWEEAFKIDGDSAHYYWVLSYFEIGLENYENANNYLKKAYAIDTNAEEIIWDLGENYSLLGQYKESLEYFKKWLKKSYSLNEDALFGTHRIGWAYLKNGHKKEAKDYFDQQVNYCNKMIDLGREPYREYYDLAATYASMGEKGKAYANLRIFNQKGYTQTWFRSAIKHDPAFNSIREEPEFQQIVRDIEAKYNTEHDRVKKCLEEQGML
jgi:TolB-like protein/Tfp pilus assembly protein PilF